MRTDVKVAVIITACLVLIAVVWYLAFYDSGGRKGTLEQEAVQDLADDSGQEVVVDAGELPRPGLGLTTPELETEPQSGVITPGYRGDSEPYRAPVFPQPQPELARADTEPLAGLPEPGTRGVSYPSRLVESDAGMTATPPGTSLDLTGARSYVVKRGDSFWAIAEREYGKGAMVWALLEANPRVRPKDLRPGMTVTIPPAPAAASPALVAVTGPARGTMDTDPITGKRFYVVKKGDRGFWDVAKIVYGGGKHYRLVEAANPGVNPRTLKPGRRIWVPESTEALPGVAYAGPPTVTPERRPGAVPSASIRIRTGAPTAAVLSDGRVFD